MAILIKSVINKTNLITFGKNILIFILGLVAINLFFLFSVVIGFILQKISFFMILGFFLFVIFFNRRYLKDYFVANLLFVIITFSIYSFVILNNIPTTGKLGFYSQCVYPPENPQKYMYGLCRRSHVFPFDRTGGAYIDDKQTLMIPDGYVTTRPITGEGWYGIVPKNFYTWNIINALIYGFYGVFIAGLIHKILNRK